MKRRHAALFCLFPILGSLAALLFRPSEEDLRRIEPSKTVPPARSRLRLPGAQNLSLIRVPSNPPFWLSEIEFPAKKGAATSMTHAEARALCEELSRQSGRRVRLPSASEWREAARAGHPNAEVPWGYGLEPPTGVAFARGAKPEKPGVALGWGFCDLAGGVWEWTEEGLLLGGAWPERNPQHLRIDAAWTPPPDYAGEDTGFRVLVEIDKPADSARK
jgi:formylglycine-generating enzyme required for sulfatase activity